MYAREILYGARSGKDGGSVYAIGAIPRTRKQKQKQGRLRGVPWSGARNTR